MPLLFATAFPLQMPIILDNYANFSLEYIFDSFLGIIAVANSQLTSKVFNSNL